MAQDMLGRRLARWLEWLDPYEDRIQPAVRRLLAKSVRTRDALDGTWLGTPLHPALTDVPIGASTTALVLDSADLLSASPRLRVAADRALVVAVLGTLPAAVTGTSDWRDLLGETRRVAALHALLNVGGLALNTCSVLARAKGRRGWGRTTSMAAYLITTLAAHVGGELSFGHAVRVNQDVGHEGPTEYTDVLDEADLPAEGMRMVEVGGAQVLLARSESGQPCAIAATCNHAGGPLQDGERSGDRVRCPWHGSCFDLRTGEVVNGPAVWGQPHYDTRVRDGRIAIRLADS